MKFFVFFFLFSLTAAGSLALPPDKGGRGDQVFTEAHPTIDYNENDDKDKYNCTQWHSWTYGCELHDYESPGCWPWQHDHCPPPVVIEKLFFCQQWRCDLKIHDGNDRKDNGGGTIDQAKGGVADDDSTSNNVDQEDSPNNKSISLVSKEKDEGDGESLVSTDCGANETIQKKMELQKLYEETKKAEKKLFETSDMLRRKLAAVRKAKKTITSRHAEEKKILSDLRILETKHEKLKREYDSVHEKIEEEKELLINATAAEAQKLDTMKSLLNKEIEAKHEALKQKEKAFTDHLQTENKKLQTRKVKVKVREKELLQNETKFLAEKKLFELKQEAAIELKKRQENFWDARKYLETTAAPEISAPAGYLVWSRNKNEIRVVHEGLSWNETRFILRDLSNLAPVKDDTSETETATIGNDGIDDTMNTSNEVCSDGRECHKIFIDSNPCVTYPGCDLCNWSIDRCPTYRVGPESTSCPAAACVSPPGPIPPPTPQPHEHSSSVGIIIGILIFVVLVTLVSLWWCYCRGNSPTGGNNEANAEGNSDASWRSLINCINDFRDRLTHRSTVDHVALDNPNLHGVPSNFPNDSSPDILNAGSSTTANEAASLLNTGTRPRRYGSTRFSIENENYKSGAVATVSPRRKSRTGASILDRRSSPTSQDRNPIIRFKKPDFVNIPLSQSLPAYKFEEGMEALSFDAGAHPPPTPLSINSSSTSDN